MSMSEVEQLAGIAALRQSVENDDEPPVGTTGPLSALWHAAKGNTEQALAAIEADTSKEAAWVRAHIHRRNGSDEEAAASYKQADQEWSMDPVDREWSQVAAGILLRG
ncbi:MAG: hypothetical protein GY798_26940 [Hyphomicrobiales bacterium]|nr:hypothetical protein [Hyphomicrobiales bacterium]